LHNLQRSLGGHRAEQERIEELADLAQQAVRETRVLSFLMNASGSQREGLKVSARRVVEGFGRRTGLEAKFRAGGPIDAVSAAAQHAVFRVTQEALSNVYRHARASKASVTVVSQGGFLTARISDDGQRFAGSMEAAKVNLRRWASGFRACARIDQLGGSLQIAAGRCGTTVTATLPVGASTQH
jgi:two-component system, NarL family, sensor kinase